MKKKSIISCLLVGALMVSAGTMAKYTKSFDSDNNTLRAAKFNVDISSKVKEFNDGAFVLVGADLKPGTNQEVYNFEINKDTEVDVEYEVALKQEGDLLEKGTPVKVILQKSVNDKWEDVSLDYKYKPESDKEKFKIIVNWPEETEGVNDVFYAGKKGNINISVNAKQVIEEKETLIEMNKEFSSVVVKGTNAVMTYNGKEGSWVTIKAVKDGDSFAFFDQGNVKDGKCEFKTVFDEPGKYVVKMNGSKGMVVFEAFEIK